MRPENWLTKSLVGRRVGQQRTQLRWTQADLAAKSRITIFRLSKIENGRVFPTLAEAAGLSEVFGWTLDELVRGFDNTTENVARARLRALEKHLSPLELQVAIRWLEALLQGLDAVPQRSE